MNCDKSHKGNYNMNKKTWKANNKDLDVILVQTSDTFNKPSHLIKQVYDSSLTINQKKLYNLLLRKLLENKKEILEINKIIIKRKDINEFFNIKKYHNLEQDLTRLQKTIITIDDKEHYTKSVLISSYDMPKDLGKNHLVIRFDTKLTQTFRDIAKYVKLPMDELQALKNTHSITLYEIFKRQLNKHSSKCKLNLSEQELRNYLNIDKDKYPKPSDFKRYVVDKPINEINTNTKVDIEYKRVKLTKGVYQYKFIFSQKLILTFNDFITRLKKLSYADGIDFTFKKKLLSYQAIDELGNYSLDIEDKDTKILLINKTIENEKDLGIKRHPSNNRETYSDDEAGEINHKIYELFLKDDILVFVYKFFILKNLDINVKSKKVIPVEFKGFCEEYKKSFI